MDHKYANGRSGSQLAETAGGGGGGSEGKDIGPVTYSQLHRLLHDIHDYQLLNFNKNMMLLYAFLVLIYIGIQFGLLGANFKPQDFIEGHYYLSFHLLEFWAVFVFTAIEALILLYTDRLGSRYVLQSSLMLFDIVATLVTALLFSIYPDEYEIDAHYMEYSIQILISCVNFVFILDYISQPANRDSFFYRWRWIEMGVAGCVVVLSFIQILIYRGWIPITIEPERAGHFCEFSNEIFNGGFAFAYAVLSYVDMKRKTDDHYSRMTGGAHAA